jgi:hypothetical protein
MGDFTPEEIMADALADLRAAGFRPVPVTPAYHWAPAQRDGENWVVRFPRHGPGEGECRIETPEMAETLAGMLNRAFGLGVSSNYQVRWEELRRRVGAELAGAQAHSDSGPGAWRAAALEDGLAKVLDVMGEIENDPGFGPAEPAAHPGGPGPPGRPGGHGLPGQLPARDQARPDAARPAPAQPGPPAPSQSAQSLDYPARGPGQAAPAAPGAERARRPGTAATGPALTGAQRRVAPRGGAGQ